MAIFYKYCDSRGVAILQKLELRISPPNRFNDPFEFSPRITCSDQVQYARRLLRDKNNIRALYSMLCKEGHSPGTFREYRKQAAEERPEMVKAFAAITPQAALAAQKVQLDRISSKVGLLCLSATRESILMWSHYCDSHKGFVLGFDACLEPFLQGKGLRPVKYVKQRVIFDALWRRGSTAFEMYDDELILSKNEDWKYEQEWRQIFKLSSLCRIQRDGLDEFFVSLPPKAIVSVTIGLRCAVETELKVRAALQDPRLSHVNIDRVDLHETEFAMKFIPA